VIESIAAIAFLALAVPFFSPSENGILDIASNTLVDILSALFPYMTIVFFLNNDSMRMKSDPDAAPNGSPGTQLGTPAVTEGPLFVS